VNIKDAPTILLYVIPHKNKTAAFWAVAGIKKVIRDVAFGDKHSTEGWVTSSDASSGRRPTDVKERMRSLSLRTIRRRPQGHQQGIKNGEKVDGDYLYGFNSSAETWLMPGRIL